MHRIGMRMIKTACAVFLCFVIYEIRQDGIPFYSAIAAVLCMQPMIADSYAKAKNRLIATGIGGIAGMIILYLFQNSMIFSHDLLRYFIISCMIIPLIWIAVTIHQPASAYISCVVFMSITVSHVQDANAFLFACNRMLDTCIGIIVALAVNAMHLPKRPHPNMVIEVPLSLLLNEEQKITTYTKLHLQRMLDKGCQLRILSGHTPSVVMQYMESFHGCMDAVLMDGTLYYDINHKRCLALHTLQASTWHTIYRNMQKQGFHPFVYEVKYEQLYVHFYQFSNQKMHAFFEQTRFLPNKHYFHHEHALDEVLHGSMLSFGIVLLEEQCQELFQLLRLFQDDITWVRFPLEEDYYVIRIYSAEILNQDPSKIMSQEHKQYYQVRKKKPVSVYDVIHDMEQQFYQ